MSQYEKYKLIFLEEKKTHKGTHTYFTTYKFNKLVRKISILLAMK